MSNLYQTYKSFLNNDTKSQLLLNLDALDQNIDYINNNSENKLVRIATKSIRSQAILKYISSKLKKPFGFMTYCTEEALWLRSLGFSNLLVGYPKWDISSLKELSQNSKDIILMVDDVKQLEQLETYANKNNPFNLCLDIDLSYDLPFLRFGVFRSPIQKIDDLNDIVNKLQQTSNLHLTAIMGYEAQIAGVGDKGKPLIQFLKNRSINQLRKTRSSIYNFLIEKKFPLKIVNGGGSGSLKSTCKEKIVTEITIGSAFYAPTLFDDYCDITFTPSLFYSLPIIRKPKNNIYTCFGGGYIASGALDSSKLPTPFLPKNASLLKHEGAGEVQTPVKIDSANLKIGDPIFFRYAKAGELCERFNTIIAFRKDKIENTFVTYRGEGKVFI